MSHIDFISNTMKKPHRIKHTDLYIFQRSIGVTKNGYDRHIDYLEKKMGLRPVEQITENAEELNAEIEKLRNNPLRDEELYETLLKRAFALKESINRINRDRINISREYEWEIYKKPEDLTYEEFIKVIKAHKTVRIGNKDYKIVRIGNIGFSPINQNFELDENNNLLLKSSGADLENDNRGGGDILLNADGKILKNTKGTMYIKPCDEFGNYPVDVFINKKNKETGSVEVVEIQHNYLDSNGHLYTKQHFSKSTEPILFTIDHTYQDEYDGEKFHESTLMYPKAYVFTDKNGIKLYPSATALLIANRDADKSIVSDEKSFLIDHYNRYNDIKKAQTKLQEAFNQEKIPFEIYRKALKTLDNEIDFMGLFLKEYETAEDLKYQDFAEEMDTNN